MDIAADVLLSPVSTVTAVSIGVVFIVLRWRLDYPGAQMCT